ncbi:oxidoreductase [Flavitalea sp.]|nr:oxidoreductase [Flavitalea sp.]
MSIKKTWFVTGASRGFGIEISKVALANGDNVVATVRSKPEKLFALLNNHDNLEVVVLDVTNEDLVKAGVQKAIDRFGRIDVLVNNAGYGLLGAVEEVSDAEVRRQYDTNVFGLLNVTRAVLPWMRKNNSGHIINISSLFGYGSSVAGLGLYGSTKYAVEGITEGLALELKSFDIHVTAVAPGLFRTEFVSSDSYIASKNVISQYEDTVGQIRAGISGLDGKQPGDPNKLAQIILRLVESPKPPLHFLAGNDALALYKQNNEKIRSEIAVWETVSASTDFSASLSHN